MWDVNRNERADVSVRCDVLALLFKRPVTGFVRTLVASKQEELKRALAGALQLD